MATEPVYHDNVEPDEFWEQHKFKILAYSAVLVIAILGYGAYAWHAQSQAHASQALFAEATTAEQFHSVIDQYPGSIAAGDAALRLAALQREAGKYDEAIATLKALIEKQPKYPLLPAAWLSLGTTYEVKGDLDEALNTYRETAERFPSEYTAPLSMMAQGRILAQQGKTEEATRIYQDVVAQHQATASAREAMRELRLLQRTTAKDEPDAPEATASPTPEAAATPAAESTPAPEATPEAEASPETSPEAEAAPSPAAAGTPEIPDAPETE
ncbi:MAG TPA: tetratricopeptide repeat protein [Chthoniobacteraceae bacterium]|nr:tetratricopeptide repeat protein [Chthoniobacteraceae bacterium]